MKFPSKKLFLFIFILNFNGILNSKSDFCTKCFQTTDNSFCSKTQFQILNCCQFHCKSNNQKHCPCEPFDNLTPEEIIDTIDDYHLKPKNRCCCCKTSEVVVIRKDDDINLDLEPVDFDVGLNALYRPPLRNALKKDLVVNTTILNPLKLFEENKENYTIYEDQFSKSDVKKTGETLQIITDLKTENIVNMIDTNHGSGFLIEKNITNQNQTFFNKNKIVGDFSTRNNFYK